MNGQILEKARVTANRGRTHVFLGHPLSDACDRTVVEPGNVFSPGVWTCGVSVWLAVGETIHACELLPEEAVAWSLIEAPGEAPIAVSRYDAGPVRVTHELLTLGAEGCEGVDFNRVTLTADRSVPVTVAIVVRDVGPAGAKIGAMQWDEAARALIVNQRIRLDVDGAAAEAVVLPADGPYDSPVGALFVQRRLEAGQPVQVDFRAIHWHGRARFAHAGAAAGPHAALRFDEASAAVRRGWPQELPARLFAPDPRVALTWERCAYHILAAMELGQPRIGAVNYPLLWLRDGVIVLRALDLFGRSDLARIGNEAVAPLYFSGGFGAEADAPGEGIWALARHARMTGDRDWAARIFPHVRARVEWLDRMRRATGPIRVITENRSAFTRNRPDGSVLCGAARDGLIRGRMDWHDPDFYINCWAVCGYRQAADMAGLLGEHALAAGWRAAGDALEQAVTRVLLPAYGNERDPAVAPHPTGVETSDPAALRQRFASWYRAKRLTPDGARNPEKLWTYFEAAQAHNAVLLGLRDEAWVNLRGMLAPAGTWDTTAFIEGRASGIEHLPFEDTARVRGWLDRQHALGGNMPHNWTSAEMICLLRSVFVIEEGDGLVLGAGVPREWMRPGARFGVQDLPTDFGKVSYTVAVGADGRPEIAYEGPSRHRVAWPKP
jgi:hypothetical protein